MERHDQAQGLNVPLIIMIRLAAVPKLLIFIQYALGDAAASFCFLSGHVSTLFSDNCIVDPSSVNVKYLSLLSHHAQKACQKKSSRSCSYC